MRNFNPTEDLKPDDKLMSCGYDWAWCYAIYSDIHDADGYKIGSNGKVYSCWKVRAKSGNGHSGTERYKSNEWKLLNQSLMNTGYYGVSLRLNDGRILWKLVHALMINNFYGVRDRKYYEAAHNNGVKTDNRFVNLRWATHRENQMDRVEHGNSNRGSRHGMSKLTDEDIDNIFKWKKSGISVKEIVVSLGGKVKERAVYAVLQGTRWSHQNHGNS